MSEVIDIHNTTQGKFQSLIEALSKLGPTLQNMEAQFGILGTVAKVEKLLEILISKKLGWNAKIYPEIKNNYIIRILTSTIVPTLHLSRRFTIDLIKAARKGDVSPVIKELKNQLNTAAHLVRDKGIDPFEENIVRYPFSYIVVEASTIGGCFHAALPVNAISLVDTDDADNAYVAQELKDKKDHFILKPTTEQIRNCLTQYFKVHNLREYLKIATVGDIKIIKEHLQEDVNKNYKILGNKISFSNIYHKEL